MKLQSNKNFITALILFLLTLSSVTIGISDVGVVWDEPNAHFLGSERVIEWVGKVTDRLARGDWKALFDDRLLQTYWPPSTKDSQNKIGFNDHPPIARYLPALSWYLFHDLFGDIESFRLSSAFLFAIVVSTLFWLMASEIGYSAGLFSALSLIVMPRVFGHAHIAATDMPMMAFWWFSILSFYKALKDSKWKYVFALFLGFSWVVKFTGLLIPVGLILYSLTAKDRRVLKIIKPVLIISPLTMWILNPTWWKNPFEVFYKNFFKLFLTREEFAQIPVYYLGKTFEFNLPWHQAFILTALTVPVSIFVLSLIGISSHFRSLTQPRLTSLFLWQLIWYYIVMMLPFTPNHDGVRLFLPVFPFLACFSGITFEKSCNLICVKAKLWNFQKIKLSFIQITLGIILLFPCSLNLIMNHPYYLEWFNGFAGGISGAHKLGFETTYWLDSVSKEARKDINQLPDYSIINVIPDQYSYFHFLQNRGLLKKKLNFKKGRADFIILIPRQGMFVNWIWDIYQKGKPIYQLKIDNVPLLLIYKIK